MFIEGFALLLLLLLRTSYLGRLLRDGVPLLGKEPDLPVDQVYHHEGVLDARLSDHLDRAVGDRLRVLRRAGRVREQVRERVSHPWFLRVAFRGGSSKRSRKQNPNFFGFGFLKILTPPTETNGSRSPLPSEHTRARCRRQTQSRDPLSQGNRSYPHRSSLTKTSNTTPRSNNTDTHR